MKYFLTESCAKAMAIKAPDSTVAHKFLARYEAIEREFKCMLLAQMEQMKSIDNRKRIADVAIQEIEVQERGITLERQKMALRVEDAKAQLDIIEKANGLLKKPNDRDRLFWNDTLRNTIRTVSPPRSPVHSDSATSMTQLIPTTSPSIVPYTFVLPSDNTAIVAPIVTTTKRSTREWPLTEWLIAHGYGKIAKQRLLRLGTLVAQEYRARYGGRSPPKRESYVDGAVRLINHYTDENKDAIEAALSQMKF